MFGISTVAAYMQSRLISTILHIHDVPSNPIS